MTQAMTNDEIPNDTGNDEIPNDEQKQRLRPRFPHACWRRATGQGHTVAWVDTDRWTLVWSNWRTIFP